ncbi:MAG: hypothetical protein LBP34_01545 [Flavobacteriaceae bacterium]|jgi:hypothetical protein|nr:hypothetical protein [Flavobacteriaceae bacterium]
MKRLSFVISVLLPVLVIFSCRDDYNYDSASKPLRFSKDTVMLDTVFSTIRSETYALKVYNQQDKDVNIPEIYLEKGGASPFKINVDGIPGGSSNNNHFRNIPIRAGDSLYIFIEIAPQAISTPEALADEDLIFNIVGHTQKVKLLSLIEDADLYFSTTGTKEISSDLLWDNTKSKVIYGNLKFINGAKLTIEEGTKVYFHKNAALTIGEGGQLHINGSLNKEVLLRGDRHAARYDSLPGGWDQICLASGALADINYAIIKGGNNAFHLDTEAQLTVSNTKIFNFLYSGIHSVGGKVTGKNLAVNNCGTADLYLEYGGTYDFTHCSFANYWDLNAGAGYSAYLSNARQTSEGEAYNALNATFKNCIFWTKNYTSIYLDDHKESSFLYTFDTNLIRNSVNEININGNPNFIAALLNEDPLFYKTGYSNTLLSLKTESPAFGKADLTYANQVPKDIKGISRTPSPALGAYQN